MASSGAAACVRCFLPGVEIAVAEAHLPPGPHTLAEIRCALGRSPNSRLSAPLPDLAGLLPQPLVAADELSRSDIAGCGKKNAPAPAPAVILEAGVCYRAALAAAPLIRFTAGAESRPHLCEEGLWLLQRLPAPVHVAVFIGLGRCGKSTTCSALARAAWKDDDTELDRFTVGHTPKAVTAGADVAAMPTVSGEGCLLVIDCEGSDNAHSHGKHSHCRILATLAFAMASHVSLCDQGINVKESMVNFLGAAVAARQMILPSQESDSALGGTKYWPKLCFLMMQSNYTWQSCDLDDALQDRDDDESRNETCRAIRDAFGARVGVRSLPKAADGAPQCRPAFSNNDAFALAVADLHAYLCQSSVMSSGLHLSGAQLGEVLGRLCQDVSRHDGYVEPDSVYARVIRQHLQGPDGLVETIAKEYCTILPALDCCQEKDAIEKQFGAESAPWKSAVAQFDGKTAHVISSIRDETRASLEELMKQRFAEVVDRNMDLRRIEEQQAQREELQRQVQEQMTEREVLQQQLRESRQRTKFLIGVAPAAILVLLCMSRAALPMLWRSPAASFEWPRPPPTEWLVTVPNTVSSSAVPTAESTTLMSEVEPSMPLVGHVANASEVADNSGTAVGFSEPTPLVRSSPVPLIGEHHSEAPTATEAKEVLTKADGTSQTAEEESTMSATKISSFSSSTPNPSSANEDRRGWSVWSRSWRGGGHARERFRQASRYLAHDASTPLIIAAVVAAAVGIKVELGNLR